MLEYFYYSKKETLHLLAMPVSSSSISLSHRQPRICFLLWWICLFWTFHVSGTMQSMVFVPDFFTGHVSKVHHVVHGLIFHCFPQQDSNHYRDLSHIHTYSHISHIIYPYIHQLVGILSSQFGITMIGKFSSFCLFFFCSLPALATVWMLTFLNGSSVLEQEEIKPGGTTGREKEQPALHLLAKMCVYPEWTQEPHQVCIGKETPITRGPGSGRSHTRKHPPCQVRDTGDTSQQHHWRKVIFPRMDQCPWDIRGLVHQHCTLREKWLDLSHSFLPRCPSSGLGEGYLLTSELPLQGMGHLLANLLFLIARAEALSPCLLLGSRQITMQSNIHL